MTLNLGRETSPDTHDMTEAPPYPFYFGIKVFNHLPTSIKKTSHDIHQFRSDLKSLLNINSFYLLEEYFAWNSNKDLGLV